MQHWCKKNTKNREAKWTKVSETEKETVLRKREREKEEERGKEIEERSKLLRKSEVSRR